jgi:hypothetical protein
MDENKMALSKILEELKQQRALLEELLVPVRQAAKNKLALIEFEKFENVVITCCENLDNVRLLRTTLFEKRRHLESVGTEEARDDLRRYILDSIEELERMKPVCDTNYVDLFCSPEDTEVKCNIHG